MAKRALRRYYKNRMKHRAKKVYYWWSDAHKVADHIKTCSCWMCGNPRKKGLGKNKITIQEQKNKLDFSDWKDII